MLLYGCSFLGFFRLGISYRNIVSAERFVIWEQKAIAKAAISRHLPGLPSWMFTNEREAYAESKAYDSASVMPIHTRSELSSDSDSTYDSASVASVSSETALTELARSPVSNEKAVFMAQAKWAGEKSLNRSKKQAAWDTRSLKKTIS